MTATPRAPVGLGTRGKRLWKDLHELTEFDPAQLAILEEACRTADRLDRLDAILRGADAEWLTLRLGADEGDVTVVLAGPLAEARQQQTVLKQLLVALRLPDVQTGAKPQHRGARGAYNPKGSAAATSGTVTALDRARAARRA